MQVGEELDTLPEPGSPATSFYHILPLLRNAGLLKG